MLDPQRIYERREAGYSRLLAKQNKALERLSIWRLLTFIAGLTLALTLYIKGYRLAGLILAFAAVILFIILVGKYENLKQKCNYTKALIRLNQTAQQRIKGEWLSFADTGEEFIDPDHNYSPDLDIFGRGSLFQWINSTHTWLGRQKLKESLLEPMNDLGSINQRQQAVDELAARITWRQRFSAEAMTITDKIKGHNVQPLLDWAVSCRELYCQRWLKLLADALPVITITTLILGFGFNLISPIIPVFLLIVQIALLFLRRKERISDLELVYNFRGSIRTYRNLLRQIEKQKFESELLQQLQDKLLNNKKQSAWMQIDQLDGITDFVANRYNLFYIIFNILFLWDYHAMFRLEGWKKQSGRLLGKWLQTIGEFEALSSLAIIGCDNPQWVKPELIQTSGIFQAEMLGHPLITKGRVCNDVGFVQGTKVLLITGSNMSGKSTLLRTVGINLLLAYIGAPVCADKLKCSMWQLYSSMRISDNLEKNYSSFYAELLRIKTIVQAVNEGQEVFFLLDEIFKGTNSYDRHIGASVLIRQLIRDGAMGMVSTHDLELAELEEDSRGEVRNYHFSEYYEGNQIHFDYKLKNGVSKTRNALPLIRMMGIEV